MFFKVLLYSIACIFVGALLGLILHNIVEARREKKKKSYRYLTDANILLNAIKNSTPKEREKLKQVIKQILNE